MKTFFTSLLLLFIFAQANSTAYAQQKDQDIKYKLGQSYERSGDYESASKLYRELYNRDSTNVVIIESLKRTYLLLKRYDDAIALMQSILRRNPNDINLVAQLGSVYIQTSNEPKAVEVWERAIALDPNKETTYRIVGSWVMQSRLFERAIEIYKRGRAACADPLLFTNDIAHLYAIMLNYKEATQEYLSLVRQNASQLMVVQTRIAGYTGRPEGLSAATTVVEQAVTADGGNIPFQKLLSWLYMEGKNFSRAFDVVKIIDQRTNAGGRELYMFAERALKEKSYDAASKAFSLVMQNYPGAEFNGQAKFGYARTLEEIDAEKDTLSIFGTTMAGAPRPESGVNQMYAKAVAAYNRVINEHPKTDLAARAQYRIGILKQEHFFDADGALKTFESLEKEYPLAASILSETRIRMGDIFLSQGDLRKAEERYVPVAGKPPFLGEIRERAALRIAELEFFRGKFSDCLTKLNDLVRNIASDATNDALGLQIFIQENVKTHEAALKEFSKADLLMRQGKLSEAIVQFEAILKNFGDAPLIDETLMKIGMSYAIMQRYEDAARMYKRFASEFPESIALDRVLIQLGRIYSLGLKDNTKAAAAYQQLLEKFPNSIYVSEARRRVRELRGDNI